MERRRAARRTTVQFWRYDAAMLIIAAAASTHRFKMAAAAAQGQRGCTHARTRSSAARAYVHAYGTARQRVHPRGCPADYICIYMYYLKTKIKCFNAHRRARASATLPPHSHIHTTQRRASACRTYTYNTRTHTTHTHARANLARGRLISLGRAAYEEEARRANSSSPPRRDAAPRRAPRHDEPGGPLSRRGCRRHSRCRALALSGAKDRGWDLARIATER